MDGLINKKHQFGAFRIISTMCIWKALPASIVFNKQLWPLSVLSKNLSLGRLNKTT